jgi:hypothetical protein
MTRLSGGDVATWVDMSPSRRRTSLGRLVALACVAIMLLASCSSKKHTVTSGSVPSTNAQGNPDVSLSLGLGALTVQAGAGVATPFNRTVAAGIRDLINKYIAAGITQPLFTGSTISGMSAYFAPSLASRIGPKGHDFAALSDQGVPVITAVTGTAKAPLALVGLEDHGRLVMVGGQFALTVKGTTAQGPLVISRIGNFVFEPNAKKQWRITGYDLVVTRDNSQTSTTQHATTTTAKS